MDLAFYERLANHWQAEMETAREAADYPAFARAEAEMNNYREMAARCRAMMNKQAT